MVLEKTQKNPNLIPGVIVSIVLWILSLFLIYKGLSREEPNLLAILLTFLFTHSLVAVVLYKSIFSYSITIRKNVLVKTYYPSRKEKHFNVSEVIFWRLGVQGNYRVFTLLINFHNNEKLIINEKTVTNFSEIVSFLKMYCLEKKLPKDKSKHYPNFHA